MSFFSRLTEIIGEEYSVQITVQKKGRNLSVSVLPKTIDPKDKAGKTLQPILVTGTPDQIDSGLISAIAQPVAALNQLVVSGKAFVKEEKKSPKKKDEPVKEEKKEDVSAQTTLKPASEIKKEKPEPAKEAVAEPAPAETFDEDTGEVMPVAEEMPESEPAAEPEAEPAAAESEVADGGQSNMFDDEDWS